MANKNPSQKRILIDKTNQRVVLVTGAAAFVVMFCLVAAHTLFSQMLYQNRIISAKKQALSQLRSDVTAAKNLDTSYKAFVSTPQNVIGGSSTGTGSQDGDNAKIVLDALPAQYDFPALATSLEKLLSAQGVQIQGITGVDDEVAQANQKGSATPQPIAMPFQISASGNYQAVQNLVKTFDASVRPMQFQTMSLSGDDSNLTITFSAQTFYQPQKTFNITTKVIK